MECLEWGTPATARGDVDQVNVKQGPGGSLLACGGCDIAVATTPPDSAHTATGLIIDSD